MRSVRSKGKEKQEISGMSPARKARDAGLDKVNPAFASEGGSTLKAAAQQVSVGSDRRAVSMPNRSRNEGENNMLGSSVPSNSQSSQRGNVVKKGRGDSGGGGSSDEPIGADVDPCELFRSPKTFRKEVSARLLNVFRSILSDHDESWHVMVLDERATRVVSSIVGMYDVMEAARVACVENLFLERQPFTEVRDG